MARAAVVLLAIVMVGCSPGPGDIHLFPPSSLLNRLDLRPAGGHWAASTSIVGDEVRLALTVEIPARVRDQRSATVVAMWAFEDQVADENNDVSTERLHEAPRAEVVPVVCDDAGTCRFNLDVVGSAAKSVDAANIDWVDHTGTGLAVTFAVMLDDGTRFQLLEPEWGTAIDGDGGTLTNPSDMSGRMSVSRPLQASKISPAELLALQFTTGGHESGSGPLHYDWVAAVRAAAAS